MSTKTASLNSKASWKKMFLNRTIRLLVSLALLLLSAFALGVAVAPAIYSSTLSSGIRFNRTPSLPIGFYKQSSGGSYVSFCPKGPYAALSLERGYRSVVSDSNACPDHGEPLLKKIVAIAGDRVVLSPLGIAVNGISLKNSSPLRLDSRGRTIPGYRFGEYVTNPGEVWVVSSYNAKSFDSRYYGPIQISDIREHLEPLAVIE